MNISDSFQENMKAVPQCKTIRVYNQILNILKTIFALESNQAQSILITRN